MTRSIKSFKRIEKTDTSDRDAELAQMTEQERFLQKQIDKLPPGWDSLRTDRYLFLFNAEKDFVKRMVDNGYTERQVRLLCEWYLRVRKAS